MVIKCIFFQLNEREGVGYNGENRTYDVEEECVQLIGGSLTPFSKNEILQKCDVKNRKCFKNETFQKMRYFKM